MLQGAGFARLFRNIYPPLEPSPAGSRFSDIDPKNARFRVLYLAASFNACFAETIVRDRFDLLTHDRTVDENELAGCELANVMITTPITVADMRSPAITAAGIPTDVSKASDHTLGRLWSAKIYEDRPDIDGLLCPSRFANDDCLAIYSRALSKIAVIDRAAITTAYGDEIVAAIGLFDLMLSRRPATRRLKPRFR